MRFEPNKPYTLNNPRNPNKGGVMPKYEVLYHLKHNDKLYPPGKVIDLPEEVGDRLHSLKRVEPKTEDKSDKKK